jgi:hypothetical protein
MYMVRWVRVSVRRQLHLPLKLKDTVLVLPTLVWLAWVLALKVQILVGAE